MKPMRCLLFMVVVAAVGAPAIKAKATGVSVHVPGVYGSIDIGGYPPPQYIYPQPIVVEPAPAHVVAEPIYLHVPPGHAKHWRRHCHSYNACGRPAYFVTEHWYQTQYLPRYRKIHYGKRHRHHHHYHHA